MLSIKLRRNFLWGSKILQSNFATIAILAKSLGTGQTIKQGLYEHGQIKSFGFHTILWKTQYYEKSVHYQVSRSLFIVKYYMLYTEAYWCRHNYAWNEQKHFLLTTAPIIPVFMTISLSFAVVDGRSDNLT